MQLFKILLAITLFAFTSFHNISAQKQISIDSVAAYIGQNVTICSKVHSTHITKGEKPVTYLNLGAPYPAQKLTIVIFHKDRSNFPVDPSEHYNKKNVCLSGELTLYEERPQIIIKLPSQITIQN